MEFANFLRELKYREGVLGTAVVACDHVQILQAQPVFITLGSFVRQQYGARGSRRRAIWFDTERRKLRE